MRTTEAVTVLQRLANAVASYAWYLVKLFWPFGLSYRYPHPNSPALLSAPGTAIGDITVSASVCPSASASGSSLVSTVGEAWARTRSSASASGIKLKRRAP